MVAGYLLGAGKPYYALALLALIGPQVIFQVKYTIPHTMLKNCLQPCDMAKRHAKLFFLSKFIVASHWFLSCCDLQFKYFLKDPVKYDVKYQVYILIHHINISF